MMTKRYIIDNYLEYSVLFKEGKDYIRCNFKGGAVSGLGSRPASFSTDKKKIQNLIENSDKFKSGVIRIAEVYGKPEPVEEEDAPEAKVKTLQQARQFLMDMGVPMEELQSKAKVLEAAKEKGITFPNL